MNRLFELVVTVAAAMAIGYLLWSLVEIALHPELFP